MEDEQNEEIIEQINANESNDKRSENNINNLNDNQKKVKEALDTINLFKNQNSIGNDNNNNQNIQMPINNENIINNEYDSYSGNRVDELNRLNINNNFEEVSMENQNLQRHINSQDQQYSPSPVKDNNIIDSNQFNYYNPSYYQNENIEQIMKTENDNDYNNTSNNINNIMNPLYKNQKYVEDSIESIIKSNMNLTPKRKTITNTNKKQLQRK